jgi:DNA-binding HxlR family transcriptional regulator
MTETLQEMMVDKHTCAASLRNVLEALYVLNGKWKLALILSLVQGPKRFTELQYQLDGITPKVLAKELKDLELNDFIKRNVYPTKPVTIIYEATAYSDTLKTVLHELDSWGAQHRKKVRESLRG